MTVHLEPEENIENLLTLILRAKSIYLAKIARNQNRSKLAG
jgi:hypothetical protein